jgi:hypothetical protein
MDIKQAVMTNLNTADFIVEGYLADLKQEELLVRPCTGINPIAWQLGHLINSEWNLVNAAAPGKLDPLPAGFSDTYGRGKKAGDNASDYLSKDEYLKIKRALRANVLRVLEAVPAADFDADAPQGLPPMMKKKGDIWLFLGAHWLMHAGQWAVTRRSIGRPPLF